MHTNLAESFEMVFQAGKDVTEANQRAEEKFNVQMHEGKPYINSRWNPLKEPEADTLHVNTLTGLVNYLDENPDGLELDKLMVHVVDATTVAVRSIPTGPHKQRPTFLNASALVPEHMFCGAKRPAYYPPSIFLPYLQSCFAEGGDLEAVIRICGNVDVEAGVNQQDDGMTQKVATRSGVVTKSEEKVPNPVVLYPFSSFVEIMQPARKMVLRFSGDTEVGVGAALIEADGGAWKITAMQSIAEWLRKELPEGVKVIS